MSLANWRAYVYAGKPQFSRTAESLLISNDGRDDRGSWFAYWEGEIAAGKQYVVAGAWPEAAGQVVVPFWQNGRFQTSFYITAPGQIVTVPAGADKMRLDCRLWNDIGTAEFTGMTLRPYEEPPEPDPDPEPVALPVPAAPIHQQARAVTGYKWGQNLALVIHPEEPLQGEDGLITFPPDYDPATELAYEVTGFLHGRTIELEIGWPVPMPVEDDPPAAEEGQ
jgi:hypothetical protein